MVDHELIREVKVYLDHSVALLRQIHLEIWFLFSEPEDIHDTGRSINDVVAQVELATLEIQLLCCLLAVAFDAGWVEDEGARFVVGKLRLLLLLCRLDCSRSPFRL